MSKTLFYYVSLLLIVLLSSCVTAPSKKPLPQAEQDAKSIDAFNRLLELSRSSDERQSVLPEMEKIYLEIIREYPDAPIVQESYWRLITIYVDDYSPPDYKKADPLYYEFLEKYPNSLMRGFVDETLGQSYYRDADWNKLLKICEPSMKNYIEKEIRPLPSLIFMYSEANFNLGRFKEAKKGYRIVTELYPNLNEALIANARLKEIDKKKLTAE